MIKKLNTKLGYLRDNLTVTKEVGERVRMLGHDGLHTISGLLVERLDFWDKYHCPNCGAETAQLKKHHKC